MTCAALLLIVDSRFEKPYLDDVAPEKSRTTKCSMMFDFSRKIKQNRRYFRNALLCM